MRSGLKTGEYESNLERWKAQQQLDLERWKAQQEANLEAWKAEQQVSMEMFRSVIASGQIALKTALLVNGGAAVALLAFIGNIWSKTQPLAVAKGLTLSLLLFGSGVLAAAVAAGVTYLTQVAFEREWRCAGTILQVTAIVLVAAGIVVFGLGVWFAQEALLMQLGR